MQQLRTAYIYTREVFCGVLQQTDEGYTFRYDPDYLQREDAAAVSLTLPLQPQAYHAKTLFPFFDGLLPEGWLLQVVVHNWKLSEKDRFGLLLVACKDCIGTVSVYAEKRG